VCCSVLQCVAVRYRVLKCAAQCAAVCYTVLYSAAQCVAVCCSVLQCVAVPCTPAVRMRWSSTWRFDVANLCDTWLVQISDTIHTNMCLSSNLCKTLTRQYQRMQGDAVCCSVLQCVAICVYQRICARLGSTRYTVMHLSTEFIRICIHQLNSKNKISYCSVLLCAVVWCNVWIRQMPRTKCHHPLPVYWGFHIDLTDLDRGFRVPTP